MQQQIFTFRLKTDGDSDGFSTRRPSAFISTDFVEFLDSTCGETTSGVEASGIVVHDNQALINDHKRATDCFQSVNASKCLWSLSMLQLAVSTFATISSIGRIEDLSLSLRMALQSKFHKEIQTFDIYLLWQTILCLRWQDGRFLQALFHIWWSTCTTLVGNELAWFKPHIFKLYTLLHYYNNSYMVIINYITL